MLINRSITKLLTSKFIAVCKHHAKKCSHDVSNETVATALPLRSRKPKSNNATMRHFVDEFTIKAQGGKGGDGSVNFLHAWAKEMGGPDGGDGGNGGHVLFHCTDMVAGLNHCKKIVRGKDGVKGMGREKTGKNAEHTIIQVPTGTIVKNEKGKVVADLNRNGMVFIAARGGSGGKGNQFFANATQQAPMIAEYGAIGESKTYHLEIKSMAHVGLLGFPNAGKSTLLRAITRARPKVEPYAFTTLNPHIGMVLYDDYQQIAVADLPGLIPDSHKNKGLGIQFLKHVERCCCLLYMLDVSVPQPWEQFNILQNELSQFEPEMLERPKLVIANKMDLQEAQENFLVLQKELNNYDIIPISAKLGTNLTLLLKAIRKIYDKSLTTKIISHKAS